MLEAVAQPTGPGITNPVCAEVEMRKIATMMETFAEHRSQGIINLV